MSVSSVAQRPPHQESDDEEDDDEEDSEELTQVEQPGFFEVLRKDGLRGIFAPLVDVSSGEEGEEDNDLEGLLKFLEELGTDRARLVEATYVVNRWAFGGIIPMTHHGFVFKTSSGDYFSLDFSRKGIVWDTYGDEPPGLPDNTTFTQAYTIDADPLRVKRYCEQTKPFSWLKNDCDTWSQGLMPVIGIKEGRRPHQQVCGGYVLQEDSEQVQVVSTKSPAMEEETMSFPSAKVTASMPQATRKEEAGEAKASQNVSPNKSNVNAGRKQRQAACA